MAEVKVIIPIELINAIEDMGKLDEYAPIMLSSGITPIYNNIKKRMKIHSQTGALYNSISITKPKKNKKGIWQCFVTFKGKDKNKSSNAVKAMVLEYGKKGQSPTPFMRPAIEESAEESNKLMQESFEYQNMLDNIKV